MLGRIQTSDHIQLSLKFIETIVFIQFVNGFEGNFQYVPCNSTYAQFCFICSVFIVFAYGMALCHLEFCTAFPSQKQSMQHITIIIACFDSSIV